MYLRRKEWFPTERLRLTGCGPSAASNILFYIDRKDNSGCCGRNRTDLLSFMEEAWQSVTPGKDGIPSTAIFLEKVEQYAKLHGKAFLNLDHGKEENLESWHWVTIAGLETTVQGGGFVYFLPSSLR